MKQWSSADSDGDTMSLGKNRGAAQILDWNARHGSGTFMPYQELAEMLFDKDELHRENLKGEDCIDETRRIVYRLREPLTSEFGRDLILGKSGARATVNGDEQADRAVTDIKHATSHLGSARRRLEAARKRGVANPERLRNIEAAATAAQNGLAAAFHEPESSISTSYDAAA